MKDSLWKLGAYFLLHSSEYLGAFESFPIYMLGFLQPLVIWFIAVTKAAASVFYPLPCGAHSWVQSSSWFSSGDNQVSTLGFWTERLMEEIQHMGAHSSGLAFRYLQSVKISNL